MEARTITCTNGRQHYATLDAGFVSTLAELTLIAGQGYRFKERGNVYTAYFLGFDWYRGEQKYLFALYDGEEFLGYYRTVNWAKLVAMSHNPIAA